MEASEKLPTGFVTIREFFEQRITEETRVLMGRIDSLERTVERSAKSVETEFSAYRASVDLQMKYLNELRTDVLTSRGIFVHVDTFEAKYQILLTRIETHGTRFDERLRVIEHAVTSNDAVSRARRLEATALAAILGALASVGLALANFFFARGHP